MRNFLASLLVAFALAISPTSAFASDWIITPPGGGGSSNITIGTTGVNGTAGLLYGDGALLQSIGATVTNTSGGSFVFDNGATSAVINKFRGGTDDFNHGQQPS